MGSDRLRETLSELRAELDRSDTADPSDREHVQAVAAEIDAWLDRSESPEDSLSGRMREAALRFEEEHPNLSSTLQRVVDALADLGI